MGRSTYHPDHLKRIITQPQLALEPGIARRAIPWIILAGHASLAARYGGCQVGDRLDGYRCAGNDPAGFISKRSSRGAILATGNLLSPVRKRFDCAGHIGRLTTH